MGKPIPRIRKVDIDRRHSNIANEWINKYKVHYSSKIVETLPITSDKKKLRMHKPSKEYTSFANTSLLILIELRKTFQPPSPGLECQIKKHH